MATRPARGERNHNWGNVVYNPANKWVGQTGRELGGGRFSTFDKPENGIRAVALILQSYQDRHGLRSIRAMFDRYAPPSENNTEGYIATVARAAGVSADQDVDVKQYAVARPMLQAIVQVELGYLPAGAASVIDEGLRRAGVVKPVETIAQAASTPTGRAAVSLTGVGSVVAVAAPVVQSFAGLPQWTAIALIVAGLLVGAWFVLHGRRSNSTLQP